MKISKVGRPGLFWLAALWLGFSPAEAQTKPPESASKIKKVLLYNKVGGWVTVNGIAEVKAAFATMAAAKGFDLVQTESDAEITLEYLKQFQAIVWNNNTNGASSVPNPKARQAILDYVDQGGGWMLISMAGDHADTWGGLRDVLGAKFVYFGNTGRAEVVIDEDARAHGELKWMVAGFPEVFDLDDEWLNFSNTVRPLPGVTVVATSRAFPGTTGVIIPPPDGSGDNVLIWAREVGQGRLLYNALGFGQKKIMEQQGGIVPSLYWENLRYVAGDYRNGCTYPASPGFDAAARVHVEDMCAPTGLMSAPIVPKWELSGGNRVRLTHPPSHPFTIRVRDIRGAKVWGRTLPAGTGEIALDGNIKSGVYFFEVFGFGPLIRQRLYLP